MVSQDRGHLFLTPYSVRGQRASILITQAFYFVKSDTEPPTILKGAIKHIMLLIERKVWGGDGGGGGVYTILQFKMRMFYHATAALCPCFINIKCLEKKLKKDAREKPVDILHV